MTLSDFISGITGGLTDFSVNTLRRVLLVVLALTVGLCVAWFAYRFVIRKVQKALHKGSL